MIIRILKNDKNEDLYCVTDICKILQLKNAAVTLKKVSIHNIFKCKTQTVSGDQICSFVNIIGLKHILSKTNSTKSKDLIKLLDLSIDIVFPGEEAHYASIIESAFDFFKIEKQYCIGNYRLDLYFPEYKLAIEIDEDNHVFRDKNEEIERETYIKNKLQCTFIRFNPSVKFFNIGMIISQIFKHIREYKNI
jgi:very-short-patch-repair endonuclease